MPGSVARVWFLALVVSHNEGSGILGGARALRQTAVLSCLSKFNKLAVAERNQMSSRRLCMGKCV